MKGLKNYNYTSRIFSFYSLKKQRKLFIYKLFIINKGKQCELELIAENDKF